MNHETLMAQGPVECRVRPLVVVQTVWVQVSADCDTVARTRTLAVTPETTVGEVMRWASAGNVIGRGDVVLTEQDHAAYDDKGEDLSAWPLKAADAIERLGIALRIKTEEHQCCTEDLLALRKNEQDGWKEAAIAWEVCASIHNKWAKGKDALYSTRHADFVKHADDARQKLTHNVK